jgi:hypothetical protein
MINARVAAQMTSINNMMIKDNPNMLTGGLAFADENTVGDFYANIGLALIHDDGQCKYQIIETDSEMVHMSANSYEKLVDMIETELNENGVMFAQ